VATRFVLTVWARARSVYQVLKLGAGEAFLGDHDAT
jgi:hypothetical protein